MDARSLYFAVLFLSAIASCKSRNFDRGSMLKHDFGKTSIAREQPPAPCTNSGLEAPFGQYIKRLVDHIVERNRSSFAGNTSREHICIKIIDNKSIGASMNSITGELFVHTGLVALESFRNDSTLASILSHELAHFSMNHPIKDRTRIKPKGYDYRKEAELTQTFNAAKANLAVTESKKREAIIDGQDFRTAYNAIKRQSSFTDIIKNPTFPKNFLAAYTTYVSDKSATNSAKIESEVSAWFFTLANQTKSRPDLISEQERNAIVVVAENFRKIPDELDSVQNEIRNAEEKLDLYRMPITQFEEEEADNVGFEFHVRAGFHPDAFSNAFMTMSKLTNSASECNKQQPLTGEPARYIRREDDYMHPNFCWRFFEAKVTERKEHEIDYAPFISAEPVINLPQFDALRTAAFQSLK